MIVELKKMKHDGDPRGTTVVGIGEERSTRSGIPGRVSHKMFNFVTSVCWGRATLQGETDFSPDGPARSPLPARPPASRSRAVLRKSRCSCSCAWTPARSIARGAFLPSAPMPGSEAMWPRA
jgi:hypothetical protein